VPVNVPNALTLLRIFLVPLLVVVLLTRMPAKEYVALGLFLFAALTDWLDGYWARRFKKVTTLGILLDPIADKVLVLAVLVMLVGQRAVPAWMVAAIVVREVLITGLRQAAIERGIVIAARDLGKLKTWAQAIAAGLGGFAAAGAWGTGVAWWSLLVAVALTWASGLDYARSAPALFRPRATVPAGPAPRTTR